MPPYSQKIRSVLARAALLAMSALLMALWQSPAQAARLALVIGNDQYANITPLKNAKNDARLISGVLKTAGFEVTQVQDLRRAQLWTAIDAFKGRINKGDEVVFYFAGHGVQIGANQLLLPTDIEAQTENQLQRDGVPLVDVQDALKDARVAVLLIDACRDNPFPKQGTRSLGGTRGLSPPEPSTGQIIMMSAGRNQKALDAVPGQNASNGLFTYELAQMLQTPGLEVRQALEQVKDRVDDQAKRVNHEQRPSVVSDLRGNFFFIAPGANVTIQVSPPVAAPAVAPVQPPVQASRPASNDPDTALWTAVESGGTADDYAVYIGQYPKGKFVALAKQRLQKLKDEAARAASAAEENAWATAESSASEAGYQSYLKAYPQGRYAALAQPRINKLKAQAEERERVAAEQKRQQQAEELEEEKRQAARPRRGGDGCWIPDRNKPWCLIVSKTIITKEGEVKVTYRNDCRWGVYATFGNQRADGSWEEDSTNLSPGRSSTWSTRSGTGAYRYNFTGSDNPSYDWVCNDKEHDPGSKIQSNGMVRP